ncbi:hypothetical protein AAF712_016226 [Marasmius tenuissimus]|uniref:Retrovirus-related Pol polyprotein from transposon TNT 1-94-like beta-barrel domain-containing protein n=1 Tax=Marasmius tenuissimus TaxID=585030 RepID=A0ABR2Z6H8_9AGAR
MFVEIYGKAHLVALTPELVKTAFRKTGLWPLDRSVITEEMMALSRETSWKVYTPIEPTTPVWVMTELMCDTVHNLAIIDEGEEGGNERAESDAEVEASIGPDSPLFTPRKHHRPKTLLTPRAANANKPTVAAVVAETNAIVDSAYVACTVFSELSSSTEYSPLIDLEKEDPAAYRDICQTYHTVLDSAATHHVIRNKSLFVQFDPLSEEMVSTGVAGDVVVKGSGICCYETKLQGSSTVLRLWMPNCLYSPNAPFNLMSGGALIEGGYSLILDNTNPRILLPKRHSPDGLHRPEWQVEFRRRLVFPAGDFVSSTSIPNNSLSPSQTPSDSPVSIMFTRSHLCDPDSIFLHHLVAPQSALSGTKLGSIAPLRLCYLTGEYIQTLSSLSTDISSLLDISTQSMCDHGGGRGLYRYIQGNNTQIYPSLSNVQQFCILLD